MRVIEKTVYTFDELSDKAKEAAREWYKDGGFDYDWWEGVFSDFQEICKILGFTLDIKRGTSEAPAIWFSGFWNQGDGASFTGRYEYAKGAAKAIAKYAPIDERLQEIAKSLQALQKRYQYRIIANITRSTMMYCHAQTMIVSSVIDRNTGDEIANAEHVAQELRWDVCGLGNWLYAQLEREWESINSNENVDETILVNEYEFYEDGTRV